MTKTFDFETRRDGCDIKPKRPKPVLQDGNAEYSYAVANAVSKPLVRGERARQDGREGLGGVFSFLGWGLVVIVVMWVFAAASPFLANALTLHGWRFCLAVSLGCLPILFVLGLMAYMIAGLRRLPRVEQIVASSFTNKAELQRRLSASYISRFLDPEQYAAVNGFADRDCNRTRAEVVNCLNRLRAGAADSRGWLSDFDLLQSMQDERADEIIKRTWQLVAIKTAASPWKIVDMIAVIYNSTVMVASLARLYNRRSSRHAAFRLVCRWFVNIYIAGEMGDAAQGAVEWASANDLISSTYKSLAGFVGRIAEGGANAFLVYRLGCKAKSYYRALINDV